MADVTSAGTGAAGLGLPAARWVLVTVWALGLASDVMGGAVAAPFGPETLALSLGLVACVVLTTRGDDLLPRRRSVVVAAAAVASGTAALASGVPLGDAWSFNFAAYVAALLITRGNVAAGLVGGGLLSLIGLGWAVASAASAAQIVDLLGLPVLALVIGTAWRWSLRRVVTRELAHEREADRSAIAANITESATRAARQELAEIGADVSPLLGQIRDGIPLDQEQLQRVAVVEAEVRDRIRSPGLRHQRLQEAVLRARQRGIRVVLLGGPHTPGDAIGDDLAVAVALLIDTVHQGTITIRAIPPGRDGVLSVLLDLADRSERFLFSKDGDLTARS